jgi:microcin C transport system permease protein
MSAYILRRLLLVIPTLLGIMIINFVLIQFVPGGPVEQIIAEMQGYGDATDAITGNTSDTEALGDQSADSKYIGARGLRPEFLAKLEKQFGLDRPPLERFLKMVWDYIRFDFGTSFHTSKSVVEMVVERLPVSITIGLWTTLLSYLVSIPLGIRKAVKDGSNFDAWTSGLLVVAYAIPSFLFAILLIVLFAGGSYWNVFPLRGLTSDSDVWNELSLAGKALDYLWHIALPVFAMMLAGFTTLTMLTKNSFLEEIRKQYVITARAKGLTESRILYGHVFRNAMLIIIAGFPSAFLGIFFGSALLIELVFSIPGLGQLGFEAALQRDYPVMFATLWVFGLVALVMGIVTDVTYVLIDPRIDFESRET